jgi:3-oxoacyl-[acyl-carrier-protein] synthase-3
MRAALFDVEYHLPEKVVTNDELARDFPDWSAERIEEKLGILERRIAAPEETAADLAMAAAQKLLGKNECERALIDYLMFCTQSPDYLLPTSSCAIQSKLNLSKCCGAFDFNLGCSGYVYGLGLAKGLVETGQARRVLLLTGETYSKLMRPDDKSTRTLFGDAGTASLIGRADGTGSIGPFVYGTDGSGGENLIVRCGGARRAGGPLADGVGLQMNGPKIFDFSMREVSESFRALLSTAELTLDDIDLIIFHQANKYMLEFLQRKLAIPSEKFYLFYSKTGNTVSNTIPIALHHAMREKRVSPGSVVALVGFGVGLSWASCIIRY